MPYTLTKLDCPGGKEISYSMDVDLFLPTSCEYVDLDMDRIHDRHDINLGDAHTQGMFKEVKKIRKILNQLNGDDKVNVRHFSKADLIKRTNSKHYADEFNKEFIDDTEVYSELIPFNYDTPHGGFYVNEKKVKLVKLFDVDEKSKSSKKVDGKNGEAIEESEGKENAGSASVTVPTKKTHKKKTLSTPVSPKKNCLDSPSKKISASAKRNVSAPCVITSKKDSIKENGKQNKINTITRVHPHSCINEIKSKENMPFKNQTNSALPIARSGIKRKTASPKPDGENESKRTKICESHKQSNI
uniref:HUN domain-containing protein n=1 Tax=Rhabditophanes sp. KR3021 TaxID=114890 RepID=A0AC35UFW3_9BILA